MSECKTCTICGQTKPLSDFSKEKQVSKDGYRNQCRACRGAALKAFRRTPEGKAAYKESQRKHYQRNKEAIKAKVKQYQMEHPEETAARHRNKYLKKPMHYKQVRADWAARNIENVRARGREYYASLGDILISDDEARRILAPGCLFCGAKEDLVLAHDVPSRKGGLYSRGNLFCLCASCNSRMRQKTLPQMFEQTSLVL